MAITPSQWSHVLTIPESYTPSSATSGQTLVITESVIAKLSTGDQSTFWSNVQNGGGDVRICTSEDGTNQLPVEIVSLDNSAQKCVIWTRKPTYDGTGDLYVFIGKAGETQPPVTDPFGRNAVWQDYLAVLHLDNTNWTDSTGNAYDATGSVSVVADNNPFNHTWAKFDQTNSLTMPTGANLNGAFLTVQAIFHRDGGSLDDAGVVSNRYSTQGSNFFQLSQREVRTVNALHDGEGENNTIGAGISNGQTAWLSVTTSASSVVGYIDGAQSGVDLSISSDNQLDTSLDTRIGTYFDNSVSRRSNGKIGEVRIQLDTLPPEYIATEYANQSDTATFFGVPTLAETSGGVVDYTITLDTGSYSLQGNTLSLLSDRNLFIGNGSYTLTEQDLNLVAQRSITLSQGIYSQQGTNTYLLVGRSLSFNTGDYLLEGSPLSLILERSITLQSGEYDYLGSNINLQYGREFRLSLEQGSYSLQGSNALLLKEHIITLDSSSYTYSADNISLLANRKITTDSGDYSYSGSPINFIYEAGGLTYTLSLDSGSYNLTGESLKLLTSRRLPIDFGMYTYEGIASKLLYNRSVALDSGVYSSAGTDLGIKVNRRLVFDNGNYSLQGTPITLSYTGEVLAILEGYSLSYKKHPVQSKYKTYNITARYN